MAYDITKKRVTETGEITLKDADGSPLLDDDGNELTVTVHGPGSKVWQQASAEQNRKRAERMRHARRFVRPHEARTAARSKPRLTMPAPIRWTFFAG